MGPRVGLAVRHHGRLPGAGKVGRPVSVIEHGARKSYVAGCRCPACTKANRAAENQRSRMIAYGTWQPYIDAGPARQHVRLLAEHGVGWKRAAMLAGISTGAMSKLMYGGPGTRPPSRRIRPETAAAILAVRPSLAALGSRCAVDATGTRRRLQALVAIGWSQSRLAARMGMLPSNFTDVMGRERVTAATRRAVATLYDELWDSPPREDGHREKISASRARNYARAHGWPPPLAWDDDALDDPGAGPAEGWQRTRDNLRGARLAAEAAELRGLGVSFLLAADRLGVPAKTLERAIQRTRRTAA